MTVWKISPKPRRMKLLLSFSGAYLLALCFLHLIPEVYQSEQLGVGAFILTGFVVQLILEILSGGIEHGHFHYHNKSEKNFPLTLMISLSIHTYLECLPLANGGTHHDHASTQSLMTGILLHNIPVAVTLMTVLMQSGISRKSVIASLVIFSLTGPAGFLTGWLFEDQLLGISPDFYRYSLALVIGIFLHVSTTILFESGEGHRFNLFKLGTVAGGSLLAFFTL